MLTGDKGETAHNIGISCGLIDPAKHSVYEIREEQLAGIEKEIGFIENKVKKNGPVENESVKRSDTGPTPINSINAEVEMADMKITKQNSKFTSSIRTINIDDVAANEEDDSSSGFCLLINGSALS